MFPAVCVDEGYDKMNGRFSVIGRRHSSGTVTKTQSVVGANHQRPAHRCNRSHLNDSVRLGVDGSVDIWRSILVLAISTHSR